MKDLPKVTTARTTADNKPIMDSQLTISSVSIKKTHFGKEYADIEANLHVKAGNGLKPVRVFAFDQPFEKVRKYLAKGKTLRLSTVWDGRGTGGIGHMKVVGPGRYIPRRAAAA